jgi:hypothetical protein
MTMIYLRQIHELVAPAVFMDEAAGALTKAERQKDSAIGQAVPLYAKVMNNPPVLIAHAPLIARAIDIPRGPGADITIASMWPSPIARVRTGHRRPECEKGACSGMSPFSAPPFSAPADKIIAPGLTCREEVK